MNYQVLNLMKVELIMNGYYFSMIIKMMSLFLKKRTQFNHLKVNLCLKLLIMPITEEL